MSRSKEIQIMDGNMAAAYISYAFSEVAGIFPITPSSPMAELADEWSAKGRKNIFGQIVEVVEMQSEGGAAGVVHGSLGAGALTTTYTASQGLLLMIPNMYKIAGELLPGVFHVSARSLSVHALSIFGDHSDVMACRQTGFAMLASTNPQEVMDLGAISHLAAIKGRIPFLHFFDGFRTSHEVQKIDALNYEDLLPLIDMEELGRFRARSLNPGHPSTRGTTQNPDIYFQQREASNQFHAAIPGIVEKYMRDIAELTGREYNLFDYYGANNATDIVIAMGSVSDTIKETVDYLNSRGDNVGFVCVRLYRPFSVEHFIKSIPETVKRIAVLDRTKEPGAVGEPLYQDVCAALYKAGRQVLIIGGRYGLASKDTTPAQIVSVFMNLNSNCPQDNFTIGIEDDVTHLSLPTLPEINVTYPGTKSCKIWGFGSDGTVGANKNTVKILGMNTDLYVQAYFVYDSKKSGGLTQSHLRFGQLPIRSPYLVNMADFVACHNQSYIGKYDMLKDLREGGVFLLNCQWGAEELDEKLPAKMKREISRKNIRFFIINAVDIAKDLGLGGRTNTILQAVFFKLMPMMPLENAMEHLKHAINDTYAKKGEDIIQLNIRAAELGINNINKVSVPESWADAVDTVSIIDTNKGKNIPPFIGNIVNVMNRQEGDCIPVSAFMGMEDGTFPAGTTAYEKRGAATETPTWNMENCIQCNQCAFVCPHAAIRPFLLDENERGNAPEGFLCSKAIGKGLDNYGYRMQVSVLDCNGCGSCANICPAKAKALKMTPFDIQSIDMKIEIKNWEYAVDSVSVKDGAVNCQTVKGSQFAQPLFEFSGACAGCGETPYIKLVTQLFGENMYIANASGCSTAYGGSAPSTPYTKNAEGRGPAWAMSLFEDTAEYAYGMLLGAESVRDAIKSSVECLAKKGIVKDCAEYWIENMDNAANSKGASEALITALNGFTPDSAEEKEKAEFILQNRDFLPKKSYWAFGGDGWAYDIGFGGLDHVLSTGKNINMLVLDTEVYSNTGGQASKATRTGAVAKFAFSGKVVKKKDLGLIAMSYGYIYVAQVAMGYDQAQTLKALREAEAYPGPSLVIAYCPCIEHGIKSGMANSQLEMKKAVESGYWSLYRYNPALKERDENPFILDSKELSGDIREFLLGENRYASLAISAPERADKLFKKVEEDVREKLERYKTLASN